MALPEQKEKLTNVTTDITVAVVILLALFALFGAFLNQIFGGYSGFLERFYSGNLGTLYRILAVIFVFLDVLLVAFVAFVLLRFTKLGRLLPGEEAPQVHTVSPRKEITGSWIHIRELANSSNPSDWNMAVLRADALLDDALTNLRYDGVSLAERLKIVDPARLPSLERVWSAHRLRNMIAHDPLEQHTKETIIHALRSYEQALKELGVMDES